MAIEVNLLEDGQGLEFIVSESVFGSEIIEAHQESHSDEIIENLRYKIVDKSGVKENYVTAEDISRIASLDRQVLEKNPKMAIAVVVPNELLDMVASVWEAYLEDDGYQIKRFFSRAEAEQWIKVTLNQKSILPGSSAGREKGA